eukprot:gene16020-21745_t
MSLGFLAKKGFHVTNVDNVEKVWLAEQKAEKESKKLKELQKQIEEERQILELRQLQVKNGQVAKVTDNSLEWMYQGPSSVQIEDKTSEEYLLGKIYQPKGSLINTNPLLEDPRKKDSSSNAWINKISSKNDSFTRLHEDPILLIKQEEKK